MIVAKLPKYNRDENRRWQNALPRKPMAALVLLWNSQGKVLILKPNYRDHWNLPGGVIDESESPIVAAIREVKEELGLQLDEAGLNLSSVDYTPAHDGFSDFLSIVFDAGVLSEEQIDQITLQEDELDELRFVTVDEAKSMLMELHGRSVEQAANSKTGFLTADTLL